jgi:putative sterol carrier protein
MTITVRDIFEAIPGRFDAKGAAGWKARIQFVFRGDGGDQDWYIQIADGNCSAGEGKVDQPTATVSTSAKTWIGMTTGTVQPMQAFTSGQLKVAGNIGDVMKLNSPQIFKREMAKKE